MTTTTMNYQLLGRSGLRVSDLCLGAMTFGEDWGWGTAKDEARKIYDTYREAGGNFIDTANIYTNGSSEKLVGEFIAGHREEVVLATKYTNAVIGFSGQPGTDANAGGNQPVPLGFPHDLMKLDPIRAVVFGGLRDRIKA